MLVICGVFLQSEDSSVTMAVWSGKQAHAVCTDLTHFTYKEEEDNTDIICGKSRFPFFIQLHNIKQTVILLR